MQKKYSLCISRDHQDCIENALQIARQLCEQQGLRLTPLRQRVLELVWQQHQPVGAYDILHQLSQDDGKPAAPPTVYRALDFLLEHGLIHRISSLNAFIGCSRPQQEHQAQFLICRLCQFTLELSCPDVAQTLARQAACNGFLVESQVVEVSGICAPCQAAV